MRAVNLTHVKAHLSRVLRRVARGETVLVLRRGRVVARILPAGNVTGEEEDALLEGLEREGSLRRPSLPPDPRALDGPMPETPPGGDLLGALLDEREEGR